MKKLQVHQFSPEIYPLKLWVTVTNRIDDLNENFTNIAGDNIYLDVPPGTEAFVPKLIVKYNDLNGILINFTGKKYITVENICHEVNHALKLIWEHLGEDVVGEEASAYLSGWMAKCIEKVKLNKE